MIAAVLTIKLYAQWTHSLKDKRMETKSLIAKIRNKFNVSVIESGDQDVHQSIVISVATLATDTSQADSILDNIINFIEISTQAQIVSIEREQR